VLEHGFAYQGKQYRTGERIRDKIATSRSKGMWMGGYPQFLPPIETEFGWSRTMATVPYVVAMIGWAVGGNSLRPIFLCGPIRITQTSTI